MRGTDIYEGRASRLLHDVCSREPRAHVFRIDGADAVSMSGNGRR